MQKNKKIEDYGFIGNMQTTALIDRHGCMEWLCMPRFDSDACFAALLGDEENGYWQIAPRDSVRSQRRHYREDTLILETHFTTDSGEVAVIDFMPLMGEGDTTVDVVRIVKGLRGQVAMQTHIAFRFFYGQIIPWVRHYENEVVAIAGPDAIHLRTPIALHGKNMQTTGTFTVNKGESAAFVLTWSSSFKNKPLFRDPQALLEKTERWWQDWSCQCQVDTPFREPVVRSLITLKALTNWETGGMVGAATTSLPEKIGGEANWDYRYTWLRDATFTLHALLASGYRAEAYAWRQWLLRAAAGGPEKLQPLYGIAGERWLPEYELDWLSGFNGCRPVRIGNGAFKQQQLDIYGEVMDGLHSGRVHNLEPDEDMWRIQCLLMEFIEQHWQETGASLWELRGETRRYTYSVAMCWVAVDRAIKAVENFDLEGDVEHWRELRQRIHDEVCEKGYHQERGTFVQYYGAEDLDASLLLLPLTGFISAKDPRMTRTIEAIQRELTYDDFVYRFKSQDKQETLIEGEGAFLVCCFWLVDNLILLERLEEAEALFNKFLAIRNDLGLLSEEYHPVKRCLLGNVPQAFSHVGLINSAHSLAKARRGIKEPVSRCGGQ
ncbi:glycoside hydrolase family 15 protein [Pistricoccus aurantiacus]|uniref:Glycoside hydrolase family 15 protein n=1 Tax=Pistricoccus aurantiacus TaxID=1883414 RepID=A0A5B8SZK8_9GAMM|nr:glycoside hydrolase family 15 protein [Pistricoccus aurantiacus]QEA40238.1 glycoside hydrolase family 15 protein [Pistricoccus aurantiacus]